MLAPESMALAFIHHLLLTKFHYKERHIPRTSVHSATLDIGPLQSHRPHPAHSLLLYSLTAVPILTPTCTLSLRSPSNSRAGWFQQRPYIDHLALYWKVCWPLFFVAALYCLDASESLNNWLESLQVSPGERALKWHNGQFYKIREFPSPHLLWPLQWKNG